MRWAIGIFVFGMAALLVGTQIDSAQTNELLDALKLKPDYEHGRTLYDTCATCHQPDGRGVAESGVPNVAGQHFQVIVKQLADFRDTERLDLRMEAFASRHHLKGPQDLADVAAFISILAPQPTRDYGSDRFTNLGMGAYVRACRSCHGAAGEGNDRLRYPRLAGQHYRYLVKRMETMIGGARRNVSRDHAQLLGNLTDEEIIGVADYLARLNDPNLPAR